MAHLKNISLMTKTQAKEELFNLTGEQCEEFLTAVEIKDRLRDAVKAERGGAHPMLTKLSTAKKDELVRRAKELKVEISEHITRPKLMAEIRKAVFIATAPKHTDELRWGKYRHMTYCEVYSKFPGYIKWIRDEVNEGSCAEMKRYAAWIESAPEDEKNSWQEPEAKTTAKSVSPSRPSSSTAATGVLRGDSRTRRRTRSPGEGDAGADQHRTKEEDWVEERRRMMEMMADMQSAMTAMKAELDNIKKGNVTDSDGWSQVPKK